MVEMARVWNKHTEDYKEKIGETTYLIPAKKFIVLDKSEAQRLVRTFTPVKRDAAGRDLRPKMLFMETFRAKGKDIPKPLTTYSCMICDGQEFTTEKSYTDHVNQNHSDKVVEDSETGELVGDAS